MIQYRSVKEKIQLAYYESENGKSPFLDWQKKLTQKIIDQVTVKLARLRLGHFGDCKSIKGSKGLFELRIHISPGFRIYFGKKGSEIIILLNGGTKGSQKREILKAEQLWNDCQQ